MASDSFLSAPHDTLSSVPSCRWPVASHFNHWLPLRLARPHFCRRFTSRTARLLARPCRHSIAFAARLRTPLPLRGPTLRSRGRPRSCASRSPVGSAAGPPLTLNVSHQIPWPQIPSSVRLAIGRPPCHRAVGLSLLPPTIGFRCGPLALTPAYALPLAESLCLRAPAGTLARSLLAFMSRPLPVFAQNLWPACHINYLRARHGPSPSLIALPAPPAIVAASAGFTVLPGLTTRSRGPSASCACRSPRPCGPRRPLNSDVSHQIPWPQIPSSVRLTIRCRPYPRLIIVKPEQTQYVQTACHTSSDSRMCNSIHVSKYAHFGYRARQ
jgi:hypothetical protein